MCRNVLWYVTICCDVFQLLQCVALCCSVLRCVVVCCRVLQCGECAFVCVCVCLSVCLCAREIENVFVRLCFSLCPFLCLFLAFSFSLSFSCTSTHILLRALSLSLYFVHCPFFLSFSLSFCVCIYLNVCVRESLSGSAKTWLIRLRARRYDATLLCARSRDILFIHMQMKCPPDALLCNSPVAVFCTVLQCVVICGNVLQSVAVCVSEL